MFHYKKGVAYKTTADSTSLYADAPANTLLNHVFCYFVHHLSKFQNMHPYRIAPDTDIEAHVATTLLIANSIDSGNLEIICMHKEGDGAQKLELFKHPEEKVLHELMSNI